MRAREAVLMAVATLSVLSQGVISEDDLSVRKACVAASTYCINGVQEGVLCRRCLASCDACAERYDWCILFGDACRDICDYENIDCSYPAGLVCYFVKRGGLPFIRCAVRDSARDSWVLLTGETQPSIADAVALMVPSKKLPVSFDEGWLLF